MSKTILLCILVFLLTVGIGGGLGYLARSGDARAPTTPARPGVARSASRERQIVIAVSGMDCSKCPDDVRRALSSVQGVRDVDVNGATKQAVVTADSRCSSGALLSALRAAGYDGSILK